MLNCKWLALLAAGAVCVWPGMPAAGEPAAAPLAELADQTAANLRRMEQASQALLDELRGVMQEAELLGRQIRLEQARAENNRDARDKLSGAAAARAGELDELLARVGALADKLENSAQQAGRTRALHSQLAELQQTRKESERQLAELHAARAEQEQRIRDARKRLRELEQQQRDFDSQAGDARAVQAELDKIRSDRETRLRELEQAAAAADAMENNALQLETRLAEMRAGLAEENTEQAALLKMRKHLEELRAAGAELEKRQAELAARRKASEKRQADLVGMLEELRRRQQALVALRAESEQLRRQTAELSKRHDGLARGAAEQEQLAAERTRQAEALQTELDNGVKQLAESERQFRDFDKLRQELEAAQAAQAAGQKDLDRAVAEAAAAADHVRRLEERLKEMRAGLSAVEEQSAAGQATRQRMVELNKERAGMEKRLKTLADERAGLEKRRASLEDQLEAMRGSLAQLEADKAANANLRRQAADLARETMALEKSAAEEAARVQERTLQVQALQAELKEAKARQSELEKQLRAGRHAGRDLEKARGRHESAEARRQAAAAQWEELGRQTAGLQEKVDAMRAEAGAVAEQLGAREALQKELARLEQSSGVLEARADSAAREQETARAEIQKLDQQAAVLSDILRELSAQTVQLRGVREELSREKQQRASLEEQLRGGAAQLSDADKLKAAEARLLAEARRVVGTEDSPAGAVRRPADEAYRAGIQAWDAGDVDGAIAAFQQTLRHDRNYTGAYYNLGVAYARKGDRQQAAQYAYQAGLLYLGQGNRSQALRMLVFLQNVNPDSPLIQALRRAMGEAAE